MKEENELKEKEANGEKGKSKKRKIIITCIVILLVLVGATFGTVLYIGTVLYYKPIIYLYPEQEMNVSVTLGYPDKITCSYPKYISGWNVDANPNGDLLDLDTGKNLYALYYESENKIDFEITNEGFVVEGKNSAEFLEEKLSKLGLTAREAEEFIVYWLPKLEANKYNYIRFATKEELEANMPLEITPEPETLIRVLMIYKGLEKPIEVKAQEIEKVERIGYTAVEWGGTEIK